MARIVSLPDFVKVIRLAEEAPAERLVFCLEITDELLAENQGVFRWTLTGLHLFLNVCLRQKTEKTPPES